MFVDFPRDGECPNSTNHLVNIVGVTIVLAI